jgi:hypothetical protein
LRETFILLFLEEYFCPHPETGKLLVGMDLEQAEINFGLMGVYLTTEKMILIVRIHKTGFHTEK